MPGSIFLSYRRQDDPGFTRALYLGLEAELGPGRLFMDVEGAIRPGDDFVEVLSSAVARCDVLLAVIGPRWAEAVAARAHDPDDFVVIEIATALRLGKRVIPVLVGGAAMPPRDGLPESIRELARRQAVEIRPERFSADLRGLCGALTGLAASAAPVRAPLAPRWADEPFPHRFVVPAPALASALRRTAFAMATSPDRATLGGVYVHPEAGPDGPTVCFVATDGHRLARVALREDAGLAAMPGALWPRDAVYSLISALDHVAGDVEVAVRAGSARVWAGTTRDIPSLADGFPNYHGIFPAAATGRVYARAAALRAAVGEVIADVPPPARVVLVPAGGALGLRRLEGGGDRSVPAEATGEPVCFDGRYLLDALQRVDDDHVEIDLSGPEGAAVVHAPGDRSALFVIMPVRM